MSVAGRITARDDWVSIGALILLAAWEASGWDLVALGHYGNVGGFTWSDHWLARTVLHYATP